MSGERGGQVWRDWLTVYGATLVAQAISGVRSLIVAALLGPQQFGLWKSLQLALSYSVWSDLGALRGLGLQVPLLRGEGRTAQVEAVQRAAWTLLFGLTTGVAVALVAAGAWASDSLLGRGLITVAPVVLTTRVLFYFFELANARKAFALKSQAVMILAMTDGVLAPLASWWGGVWLFIWSVTATNALVIAYFTVRLSFSWRLSWRPADMRAVSAVGFPIAIAGFAFEVLRTVDRFVIVSFIGTEAVGYYGLAMIVFDLTVIIPVVFGQVMLPHVAEQFGKEGDASRLFDDAERITATVNRFLPFLLAVGWILLPAVTRALLPAYTPGIAAARILLWATIFVTVNSIASVVLITLRHRVLLILLNGAALVVGGVLCGGAVKAGLGITGVAGAMLVTYGLAAVADFLVTGRLCGRRFGHLLREFTRLCRPAAVAVVLVILIEYVMHAWPVPGTAAAGIVAFAALGAIVVWWKYRLHSLKVRPASLMADTEEVGAHALVSVVLPVRNGADCIERAVQSILRQTYNPLELIVVDDCSDDATPEILTAIRDRRLRVVGLDHRVGVTAARNVGIRASAGVLVAAMDADDVSHPDRIAKEAEFLRHHGDYAMVACGFDCVDVTGRVLDRVYPPTEDGAIRCLLIRANPFAQSAIMVRRDAIERVGLYDEAMHYAEDYDLYLRLAQHWKLASVSEVLHQIRVHPASQTQRLENRICYFDVLARARAIIRGQYPLSSLRQLVPTAISMIVPLWLKRLRRCWRGDRYSYYRRSSTDPTWSGDAAHSGGSVGVNVTNPGGENLPARRTRPAGADGLE